MKSMLAGGLTKRGKLLFPLLKSEFGHGSKHITEYFEVMRPFPINYRSKLGIECALKIDYR